MGLSLGSNVKLRAHFVLLPGRTRFSSFYKLYHMGLGEIWLGKAGTVLSFFLAGPFLMSVFHPGAIISLVALNR